MTCDEFRDHLTDHHHDELEVEIREKFEVHRTTCPDCDAYHESYTHTVTLTGRLPKGGPLPAAVEARLREVLKDYLG